MKVRVPFVNLFVYWSTTRLLMLVHVMFFVMLFGLFVMLLSGCQDSTSSVSNSSGHNG